MQVVEVDVPDRWVAYKSAETSSGMTTNPSTTIPANIQILSPVVHVHGATSPGSVDSIR